MEASESDKLIEILKGRFDQNKRRHDGSAMERAEEMGIELLTERQYRQLQKSGQFDLRTSKG